MGVVRIPRPSSILLRACRTALDVTPNCIYMLLFWRVHRLIVAVVRMQPCSMGKVPLSGVKPEYPPVYNTGVFDEYIFPPNCVLYTVDVASGTDD